MWVLKGWLEMDIDEELNNMLDGLIAKIQIIIENKSMQSRHGSLKFLEKHVMEMKEQKLYLTKTHKRSLVVPRWLGECGDITPEEIDVHDSVLRINHYIWGKYK